METTSFRTRTTQQRQPPPQTSSRQWFRLSTLPAGNSATTIATAATGTAAATAASTGTSRLATPQDQKPSGHVGLPTRNGRSTPLVTSPSLSNSKISLVTLSPPPATTTSSPLPSPSPSFPSPPPSVATIEESRTNTTPSVASTPVPKPTSESKVTQPSLSLKPSENNEPQAPNSSPSRLPNASPSEVSSFPSTHRATTVPLSLPSPSPSPPSPSPSLATTKEVKTNKTPSPPLAPVQKPTSESRVTQLSWSPETNRNNNEPQALYSSPSKVLLSPTTSPRHQPILPSKFKTNHKHYTTTATPAAAAIALIDEEKNEFISFAGKNRGTVFVDIADPPNNHRSFKYCSSDDEIRSHGYSKNEHPASVGGLGAFANSNVQGVNNSLLFNSSFLHHDPGVHIIYYETITSSMK